MYQSMSSVITSLNRKVSPGNVSQAKDIYGTCSEATRNILSMIQPKELSKRMTLENALYDQTNKYHCPDDLDQQHVMQVYRMDGNRNVDTWENPIMQVTNRKFDQHRVGDRNMITIEYDKGAKFIKLKDLGETTGVDYQNNRGLTIHTMNSLTENGTWNTFGNVTNLITDNLTYVAGNGSLRFDINDSSNTGGIENFTLQPFNLKEFLVIGKIFTWLYLPQVQQIQTIQLEMYSSPGNGYSITVNSPYDTDQFQLEQNMLGFILDPANMVTIGTPDPENLNHIRFTFTVNATLIMNGIRMDNIVARKGTVYGIQYISKYMFQDVHGLFKEYPTMGTDLVMLEYQAFQIYLQECAVVLGEEIFTDTAMNKKGMIFGKLGQMQGKLAALYQKFKKDNKSEYIDEQQVMAYFGVQFGYNNRGGWDGHRFDHGNNGDTA